MDQTDPLGVPDHEDLLRFLHCKKTEMSCIENPQTFLNQLRDRDLIPESRYKKLSRMRNKENQKRGVYQVLDWVERERPRRIGDFWGCVFEDHILNQYPTLRLLRNSLLDGSFRLHTQLLEELSEEEDEEKQLDHRKKKRRVRRVYGDEDDDNEQPGPSSRVFPQQKKTPKKVPFSPPLKKGEKNKVWTWPLYQTVMPVTCGDLEGSLNKNKLAKGEKCIYSNKQWFTPGQFERFAGMERMKNWKLSIHCRGAPLGEIIQQKQLKVASYKRGPAKAKRSLFPLVTDEDEEEESADEEAQSAGDDTDEEESPAEMNQVFKVTCGATAGFLHTRRFASGSHGKSIRTETSWMSPEEFVKAASPQSDAQWKKDITCEGNPLGVLIKENVLTIHSVHCDCWLCSLDQERPDDQRNDDQCCVCRGDGRLVQCDDCPLSFHQSCHLPQVEPAVMGDERPWMCTFCEFSHYSSSERLEMPAAMSQYISRHTLKCQYLLLYLRCPDKQRTLASDPHDRLQTPMWFGEVADRLQGKDYHTVGEFVSDVQQVFTDCAQNAGDGELVARGARLKELFDGEFKKVFNIQQTDN